MSLIKKLQSTCSNNYIQEGFNGGERSGDNRLVTKPGRALRLFHQVSDIYKALCLVGAGDTVGLCSCHKSFLSSDGWQSLQGFQMSSYTTFCYSIFFFIFAWLLGH